MIDKVLDYLRSTLVDPGEFNEYIYAAIQKAAFVQSYGGEEDLQVAAALSDTVLLDDVTPDKLVKENHWLTGLSMNLILLFNRRQVRPSWGEWADEINSKIKALSSNELLMLLADRCEHIRGTIRKIPVAMTKLDKGTLGLINKSRALVEGIRKRKIDFGRLRIEDATLELEELINSLQAKAYTSGTDN